MARRAGRMRRDRRGVAAVGLLCVLAAGCAETEGPEVGRPTPEAPSVAPSPPAAAPTTPPSSSPSPSPGLPPPPPTVEVSDLPAGAGDHEGVATVDGRQRRFVLHHPAGIDAPAPLLLALHPLGTRPEAMAGLTGLDAAADREGVIVVYPEGRGLSWNASSTCCPPATFERVDDVGFLRGLVTGLVEQLPVDPQRVWATGFSNGGFMALRLGCEASDVVAAVAAVAATMDLPCQPQHPVSVLLVHGENDAVVPLAGGRGPISPQAVGRGAEAIAAAWRDLAGCPPPAEKTSDTAREIVASDCDAGTEVRLLVARAVGHRWPTSPLDATAEILDWLEDQPPRELPV